MARTVNDMSIAPIIAFDFDGTITKQDHYPTVGEPREFAKEVINFLIDAGVKVVIYTSRDAAIDQDKMVVHDDITPAIKFLQSNGIKFSSINKSIQFAPFLYNSRKVYAHMYVDDKGYGWIESKCCLLYVLADILAKFCFCTQDDISAITGAIARGEDVSGYARQIASHLALCWV